MTLTRRQKLILFQLLLYWPAIFILAHIPIPKLVYKARISDKTLHFLVYLILAFLLWFATNPYKKVNWRKASVWWILFVVVWYGVIDEWSQAFVGRNPAVMDFFADLAGTLAGLILFSFFTFWPAFLIVTAITIFLLTNLARANLAELLPVTNIIFHLCAYSFFSLLWIRIMSQHVHLKPHKPKWLTVALALPFGLLLIVKLSSIILSRNIGLWDVAISTAAIVAIVAVIFMTALFRQHFTQDSTSPSQ
ncbi:MAG: VanZ family protein [Planctomycetota bacterium]|jgi:VanZ family protein